MMDSKKIVEGYLEEADWRVRENSNATTSVGAMTKYMAGEISKDYWLREVYNPVNPEIAKAYIDGHMHIHDLGSGLTLYCCGYSLKDILQKGVRGVPNIPASSPAKHFDSALAQVVNLTSIFQNEIAGAVAFSSVDTLLAPYIKVDNLDYDHVKQSLQNFIFAINSNSRAGAEPAFSNVTLDLTPPHDLVDLPVIIAGETQDFTYRDCQQEMDLFNRAFCELMCNGDSEGKPFAYPIPTYNIHKRFDWDNPNNELLWKMAGQYGYPYFANYINSDMDPSEARSMCCRLRLDMRELTKRGGGLFGSGDSTGSIGVVTINLPRLAYEASKDIGMHLAGYPDLQEDMGDKLAKEKFYSYLDHYMDLAKESLEIKRQFLQDKILNANLLPAFMEYVGTMDNHFSTIGLIGLNEMCENLLGVDILSDEGKQFSLEVLDHMREKLSDYQEETGHLYNLEATPAESTAYRLAMIDKKYCTYIASQGPNDAPYYTNSCHIPVSKITGIKDLFDHQDELQCKFTGGTVVHLYCDGPMSGAQAKSLVKSICTNYKLPYISLSPLITICPEHGQLNKPHEKCPLCGAETKMLQRITGYIRDVKNWNPGKKSEFQDRKQLSL